MDEHSILSDSIIDEIQKKYPDDYLNIISQIDKSLFIYRYKRKKLNYLTIIWWYQMTY
ncbi:MAG: hypothetical protein L6V91_00065 [Bacilli bacterium]|nr:MAG: hypothetical protein L6V91_00065 [Bacilli bacterium]